MNMYGINGDEFDELCVSFGDSIKGKARVQIWWSNYDFLLI